ncbi:hypothetical protein EJ04DRAFT_566985 [Polyplosphaeria fusca]|uniref:Uncharacterized protein n=1 Tax=Polyplosphaeria fusca TaxID=682080 RepID=A0A9P4QUJ5_9PLEO|nr:hypothetical protein EJ04DRAFT_566985 [Polyplosphaeria fusca]
MASTFHGPVSGHAVVAAQYCGAGGTMNFHLGPNPASEEQHKRKPSSTVPFRRDNDFVFRDSLNEVRWICACPAGRAALVGIGGVGQAADAMDEYP